MYNSLVEQYLTEEPTVVYENVFNKKQLNELKKVVLDFLNANYDFSQGGVWARKGGIHKVEYIKNLSKLYLNKFLPRQDAELIGDTAFIIGYPPHDIHIDCLDFRMVPEHRGIVSYKSMVIPVEINCDEYPILYTADQYYYGPSTRLRQGCELIDKDSTEILRQQAAGVDFIYDYESAGVKYLAKELLTKEWYDRYIDSMDTVPYESFYGISIEKENKWQPGNIIVFDSARIHFAQNISKVGAKYKIGISLNYGISTDIEEKYVQNI